jgi:uncharacterized integral membrane protein
MKTKNWKALSIIFASAFALSIGIFFLAHALPQAPFPLLFWIINLPAGVVAGIVSLCIHLDFDPRFLSDGYLYFILCIISFFSAVVWMLLFALIPRIIKQSNQAR